MVFGTAVVRSLLRSVSAHKSASYVLAANRYAIGASKVNHVACCTPRRMFSTEDYKESIQKRVLGVCENFEKLKDAKISLSSNFTNDLGLDSLDFVELIMAVEDEFGLEIPDVESEKLVTPQCIIDMLVSKKERLLKC